MIANSRYGKTITLLLFLYYCFTFISFGVKDTGKVCI